ncbi:hypothetical protein E0493_11660 [Roseomonas sp. M0104]|uniref:Uncharacterized protein n=1 Tax=Teichococcus coralli TaxID=2545983 RepID=A0A845BD04_9PROT|nr:hypothetical protein [Pseudoroseomonas coralli]MXP64000.1 hypothetical protein [Pseudoroseomonas coralli]
MIATFLSVPRAPGSIFTRPGSASLLPSAAAGVLGVAAMKGSRQGRYPIGLAIAAGERSPRPPPTSPQPRQALNGTFIPNRASSQQRSMPGAVRRRGAADAMDRQVGSRAASGVPRAAIKRDAGQPAMAQQACEIEPMPAMPASLRPSTTKT